MAALAAQILLAWTLTDLIGHPASRGGDLFVSSGEKPFSYTQAGRA